jgi:hypothetical protein
MKTSDREQSGASNAFTSAFKALEPIPQFKATAKLDEFLETRVLTIVLAVSLPTGDARHHLIAHLATSTERDGTGDRDHPWAVNVVHNLPDFLADHLHTNDRV